MRFAQFAARASLVRSKDNLCRRMPDKPCRNSGRNDRHDRHDRHFRCFWVVPQFENFGPSPIAKLSAKH
jgi:hypothetical protein